MRPTPFLRPTPGTSADVPDVPSNTPMGMRGQKQERECVRQGAKNEGEGGRETWKIGPETGAGRGEKFCGHQASLYNDYNVTDIEWAEPLKRCPVKCGAVPSSEQTFNNCEIYMFLLKH